MGKPAVLSLLPLLVAVVNSKRGVLLTTPNVWLAGAMEKSCLSSTVGTDLNVSLTISANKNSFVEEDHHIFRNGEPGCFEMMIPKDVDASQAEIHLHVISITGNYEFKDSHKIAIQRAPSITSLVFIQTDKPIYKPKQTVKIRIYSLSRNFHPHLQPIDQVIIQDPSKTRIAQWMDIQSTKGITSLEFPLSEEPLLGKWKIKATSDGIDYVTTFAVDEYVLPKFEVLINPQKSYIPIDATTVEVEFCAKYTYGKPVTGQLELSMQIRGSSGWGYYRRKNTRPIFTSTQSLQSGCYTENVTADYLHLAIKQYPRWDNILQINASVTETNTGQIMTAAKTVKVEHTVMKLEVKGKEYKPGLPYHGQAILTYPDGAHVPHENVAVTMESWEEGIRYSKNFVTNELGIANFDLPNVKWNRVKSTFSLEAKVLKYERQSGGNGYHPTSVNGYLSLKRWYSPSHSYIQLTPPNTTVGCEDTLRVHVAYTTFPNTDKHFIYQVISHRDIIHQGRHSHHHGAALHHHTPAESQGWRTEQIQRPYRTLEPPSNEDGPLMLDFPSNMETAHFHIAIPVRSSMAGGAVVMVYYIRPDGEVVGDTKTVDITRCLKNKVELNFSPNEKYPGDTVSMKIKADKGSLCAYGAVDKSVTLLGKGNEPTLAKVFDHIEALKAVHYHSYLDISDRIYCKNKLQEQGDDDVDEDGNGRIIPVPPQPFQPALPAGPPAPPRNRGVGNRRGLRKQNRRNQKKRQGTRSKRSSIPWRTSYKTYQLDTSKAFKEAKLIQMSDLIINTRQCSKERDHPIVYYSSIPTMDGIPGPGARRRAKSRKNPISATMGNTENTVELEKPTVDMRNYFPETWLWDLEEIGDSGMVTIPKELPHTITEWIGSAFCTNMESGFGISPVASVKAFQPFFMSFTLPYSVVRGETVNMPVSVFNYLGECLVVQLTLKTTAALTLVHGSHSVEICVCAQQASSHTFVIKASQLGDVNVTMKAETVDNAVVCNNQIISPQIGARDAVTQKLLVEAEGEEKEVTQGLFICIDSTHNETMSLTIPDTRVVPGTKRGYISVIGDVMGPALNGLDKLLRLPTGCGEQNMLKFSPNIYILQYLTATDQLVQSIETKALEFLKTGYQRELQYRHDDGSYSAFGNRDTEGSTWLTAFVLKSFAQARPFIFIDPDNLQKSIQWLRRTQLENGCFPQVGRVLHKDMKGGLASGSDSDAPLTAYVLISLLEAGVDKSNEVVQSAVQCLEQQTFSDAYTTSLVAFAYSLLHANGKLYQNMMQRLNNLALEGGGMKNWQSRSSGPVSANVEVTAYALMATMNGIGTQHSEIHNLLPIVKWLTAQRNENGGFQSTQDTVVGLQALAQFASLVYNPNSATSVVVRGIDTTHSFSVTPHNSLLLQQRPVAVPNNLHIKVDGQGCVLVQSTVKYNIQVSRDQPPAFALRTRVNRHKTNDCKRRELMVCANYLGVEGPVSNMAVISVKMVSGWIPVKSTVKRLKNSVELMLKRVDIESNMVHFYFDEIGSGSKCLKFDVEQDILVNDAKPAMIHVYDYYNTDLFHREEYNIRSICGTKEEIPLDFTVAPDGGAGSNGFVGQRRLPPEPFNPHLLSNATILTQSGPARKCPRCEGKIPLKELKSIYCNIDHVYYGKVKTSKVKFVHDMRPDTRTLVKLNVKVELDDSCQCNILTGSKNKVFIWTNKAPQPVSLNKRKKNTEMRLDGDDLVTLAHNKHIRKLRKHSDCMQVEP